METKLKATPGPWMLIDIIGSCSVYAGKRQVLQYAHSPDAENKANACLIAAAPDLYSALQKAAAVLSGQAMTKQELVNALEAAQKALAKARGEA